MRKLLENSKKILTLVLIIAIMFVATTNYTKAADQTIALGGAENVPAYIGQTYFTTKTLTSGELVYCIEMPKKTPVNTTANLAGEADAGLAYLVTNGYPNKTFTGERLKDYYITQTAIWWYLDEVQGTSNLGSGFKAGTVADNYNMRHFVVDLKNGALQARNAGYAKTTIQLGIDSTNLEKDGEYYVSKPITATVGNASTYTVSVKEGTTNTKVYSLNGEEKTSFGKDEKFMIKVPAAEVTNGLKVTVTANAKGSVTKAFYYKPVDGSMQSIVRTKVENQESNAAIDMSVTLEKVNTKVTITKIDAATKQIVVGATLVIRNEAGEVVKRFVSTETPEVITDLEFGKYTIEEEEAPKGYIASDEKLAFTLDGKNIEFVVDFENQKQPEVVPVPDTATSGLLFAGLGIMIVGTGLGFVYKNGQAK